MVRLPPPPSVTFFPVPEPLYVEHHSDNDTSKLTDFRNQPIPIQERGTSPFLTFLSNTMDASISS